ncbi:MAG: transferase spermidine synthase, partial [Rhizobacter sp.]|nr:transferase spermidine synthase [Rhizobacter sp.]
MHDLIVNGPDVCDIERTDDHVKPYVHEGLDSKSMHFSICEIQSRMQILRPDVLELEYTRTMMGVLMFAPEPERIAMIGLGGGSLAKFCFRHFPQARVTGLVLPAALLAQRAQFPLP